MWVLRWSLVALTQSPNPLSVGPVYRQHLRGFRRSRSMCPSSHPASGLAYGSGRRRDRLGDQGMEVLSVRIATLGASRRVVWRREVLPRRNTTRPSPVSACADESLDPRGSARAVAGQRSRQSFSLSAGRGWIAGGDGERGRKTGQAYLGKFQNQLSREKRYAIQTVPGGSALANGG